jgi:coenzyme F420-dependent glucose-6-phosphate dehydrogenase
MINLGYALSSEEHAPMDLVNNAVRAESTGFTFALISDHFHPWVPTQGESAFVWSTLGALAHATRSLKIGTGVTCPMIRTHPVIVAQAAATVGAMMPGRFFLGLGTGENLNEHVVGEGWPTPDERLEMLAEAIVVIRAMFTGDRQNHRGQYYTVEEARLYTLPDEPVPIMIAAKGELAAELAGRMGDGFIGTTPEPEVIKTFQDAGGQGKPRYGQITVCYARDEGEAKRVAYKWWPNSALKGPLSTELRSPEDFEAAAEMVTEEDVSASVICDPDPQYHVDQIRKYAEAGYDNVYIHQVGPDQDSFFDFYQREVLPRLDREQLRAAG